MPLRCIFFRIEHPALPGIEVFRHAHDPLFGKVPPHVTLVHPFESQMSTELLWHHVTRQVNALEASSFDCDRPSWENGYASLNLIDAEPLRELRRRIYTGKLESFLSPDHPYVPHITLGRYVSEVQAQTQRLAAEGLSFAGTAKLTALVLERICEDESSEIERELTL